MKELSGNIGNDSLFESISTSETQNLDFQSSSPENTSERSVRIPENAFDIDKQSFRDAIINAFLANGGPHEVPTKTEVEKMAGEVLIYLYGIVSAPKKSDKVAV